MAEPYTDDELEAAFARYCPGSMLDSSGVERLMLTAQRLRTERDRYGEGLLKATQLAEDAVAAGQKLQAQRDQAVEDATFLSECAAKLMVGGDALIEECVEAAHDTLQRELRRTFDPLRLTDVMGRYAGDELEVPHG